MMQPKHLRHSDRCLAIKAKFARMKSLAYLNRYFFKYRWRLLLGILFVLISNVFGVIPPQIIRYSIDIISERIVTFKLFEQSGFKDNLLIETSGYLLLFAALVLLLSFLKGVFMFFMRQTIIVMSRYIEFDLKNDLYEKYQHLSLSFFRRSSTGDLMARISEDVGKVRMYVGPALMYGINLIALFSVVIPVMIRVNPLLTLYVLLPLPVLSVGIYYVNNIILRRSTAIQEKLGELTSYTQEAFSGIRVIKSYGLERVYLNTFGKELDDYREKSMKLVKVDALFFPLTLLLIGLSTIITVSIGGVQVSKGNITPGNIAEFVIYVNMLTWPVTSLGWVASIIQQAAASQARINKLMEEPLEFVEGGIEVPIGGKIAFHKVSFTYRDSGIEAIRDISFSLEPGKTLGIVGRTGSGKSTLANLITRMFDPNKGEIQLDDIDLKTLNVGHYRSQLGYVPQDVFLFSDSIRNNIGFGKQTATEAELYEAAELAALSQTLENLPNGLDTVLGERGITLSGGQKQRLSIARAIVKKPKLYVIDDCLSALDTKTEQQILTNIHKITAGVSSIIISHRVSSVMNADHIIVLDQGSMVEEGTHLELLSKNGYYASIHQKQQSTPSAQLPALD